MSRIGKKPIEIPEGVAVAIEGNVVTAKGPKGELSFEAHRDIAVAMKDNTVECSVARNSKKAAALWGTTRARLANVIAGVHEGFEKKLEIQGVGYRANLKGKDLEISVGFSHPVLVEAPEGISFAVEKEIVTVTGIDTVQVGQVASNLRKIRPPEPYKGKGIRYVGEHVRRKVGKVVGSTGE